MYREVPNSVFETNQKYDFDIYLRINGNYHLFAARGTLLNETHLDMLRTGGTKVYARKSDKLAIEKCLTSRLDDVVADPQMRVREKARLVYDSTMDSVKNVYRGVAPKTIADIEKNADHLVKMFLADSNMFHHLKAIDTSDHFSYQHSVRVGVYATALTLKLFGHKLSSRELARLSMGYILHDIGMAAIPVEILDKVDTLTIPEWNLIRMHPVWGRDKVANSNAVSYESISIILHHHERFDGGGYPNGLNGDCIPVFAKICIIADAYESLTSFRPYRKPLDPFSALQVMYREMSGEFDPAFFSSFVKLLGSEV